VITGGSKGLGKALAREMLLAGDRVLVTSRTRSGVDQAVNQLKAELGPRTQVGGWVGGLVVGWV
jgi:chlorophyll(ide) b reductase